MCKTGWLKIFDYMLEELAFMELYIILPKKHIIHLSDPIAPGQSLKLSSKNRSKYNLLIKQ